MCPINNSMCKPSKIVLIKVNIQTSNQLWPVETPGPDVIVGPHGQPMCSTINSYGTSKAYHRPNYRFV